MSESRRDLLARPWIFVAATVAVGLLCWVGARQVLALTENPLRLDIFFHLFWVQEPHAVLAYFGVVVVAVAAAFVIPATWPAAVAGFVARRRWLVAALLTTVLAVGSVTVYRATPISMDEYAAAQQAEIFASLRLAGSYPAMLFERLIPEFFLGYFFTPSADGDFVSNYWPGHSLLMAPFAFFGAPWLLNPVLGGVALLLLGFAARKSLVDLDPDRATELSGWAMLFALASPELLANAVSFYSMTAHLVFNLAFALLLRRPTDFRVWSAGLVGGYALTLHQPVPHALFALPWALWILTTPLRFRRLFVLALGYVPFVLFLGVGWFAYRAELQKAPLPDQLSPPGFEQGGPGAPELGDEVRGEGGVGETLTRLVSSAIQVPTAFSLWTRSLGYAKLVLWTLPGLPILALFALLTLSRGSPPRPSGSAPLEENFSPMHGALWLRLLAASALTTIVFYVFVSFSQGHGWGFRYFHPAWSCLPLLGAAGLAGVGSGKRWRRLLLALVVLSLLTGGALRSLQIRAFIDRQVSQVPPVPELRAGERLVQFLHPHRGFYRADLIRNDPFLRDAVLHFVSVDAESDERFVREVFPSAVLEARYGEETVWRVPPAARRSEPEPVTAPAPEVTPRGPSP